jgi:hypothetical protein
MAQLIATIALSLSIILLQHLYNWVARRLWENEKQDGIVALFLITLINIIFCVVLLNLIISINK